MIGVRKQLRLIAIRMDHLARRVVDFVMVNHFFIFDAYKAKSKSIYPSFIFLKELSHWHSLKEMFLFLRRDLWLSKLLPLLGNCWFLKFHYHLDTRDTLLSFSNTLILLSLQTLMKWFSGMTPVSSNTCYDVYNNCKDICYWYSGNECNLSCNRC